MSIVWHIVGKDLRRFSPVIALAVGIHLFGYCLALSNLDANRSIAGLSKVFQMAPMAGWVATFLLSAWVILEDRGVGDRVAWLTRPILAREILAAKCIFLIVAVALPAGGVSTGVAFWLKAPLGTALSAGTSATLVALFGAAIFAPVAVISSSMNQAVLFLASAFGGVVAISYLCFDLLQIQLPPRPTGPSPATHFLVMVATACLGAVATLGHQYATRRTLRTVLLAIGAGLAAYVFGNFWPLEFWPGTEEHLALAPTDPAKLKLVATGDAADFLTMQNAFIDDQAFVSIRLRLEGAPPDRTFVPTRTNPKLVMDNGGDVPLIQFGGGRVVFEQSHVVASSVGYPHSDPPVTSYVPVILMPLDVFRSLQGQSGRFTDEVTLVEKHYEVASRLPVQPGVKFVNGGQLSRIKLMRFENGYFVVGFQFVQVTSLGAIRPGYPNHALLVNAKRQEYAELQGGNSAGTGNPDMNFITSQNRFSITRDMATSAEVGRVDADWVKDAEFWFLVAKNVDGPPLHLALTVDSLTIPTKPIVRHVIVINPDGTRTESDR